MDTLHLTAFLTSGMGAPDQEAMKAVMLGSVSLALMAVTLITLILKMALVAAAVWVETAWPRLASATLDYYQTRPWRCYIAGVVNASLGTLLTLLLLASGVLTLLGLLTAGLLIFLGILGFAAAYRMAARRLHPEEPDTLRALVLGGAVTELVALVPFFGQVYHLHLLLRGLGAATLALLSQRRSRNQGEA